MNFRQLEKKDKIIFNEYLKEFKTLYNNVIGSEFCFESLFAWKDLEKLEIYINKTYIIIKGKYLGKPYFLPPIAISLDEFKKALNDLNEYCLKNNLYNIILEVDNSFKHLYLFDDFLLYENTDLDEYIYSSNDLINLKGNKYHSKRNHIARFKKLYDYEFSLYNESDYNLLINCLLKWDNIDINNNEVIALKNILDNIDLGYNIYLLKVSNTLVAFTIFVYSTINDSVYVLFEKADINYLGSYQAINNFNATENFKNVTYINRQEDIGINNLRKAKLSYYPLYLTKKYSIIPNSLIENIKKLYTTTFNDSFEFNEVVFKALNFHDIEYIDLNKEIISILFLHKKTLSFFNKDFQIYLITGLTTKKEYRNIGYSKKLLQKTFINLLKKEVSFVYLYPDPVSYEYYYNFGFGLMNYQNLDHIKSNNIGEISSIINFYENLVINHSIYLKRTEADYQSLNQKIKAYKGTIYTNEFGYVIKSENQVEESININSNEFKNGVVCRILDIKNVLKNINYEFDFDINIKIIDQFIESNNCCINIVHKNGLVLINDSTSFEKELTIKEITESIFNTNSHLNIFPKVNVLNNDNY